MIARDPDVEQSDVWRQVAGETLALLLRVAPRLRMVDPSLANAVELLRQATGTWDREGRLPTEKDGRALREALARAAGPGGDARVRIALYRSDHLIKPSPGSRHGWPVEECGVDRLRINPLRGGGYRHDPGEIRELVEEAGR